VVLSTIPASSPDAQKHGLVAVTGAADAATPATLEIRLRNVAVLSAPLDRLTSPDCRVTVTPIGSADRVDCVWHGGCFRCGVGR
jgi:hypothetical protein